MPDDVRNVDVLARLDALERAVAALQARRARSDHPALTDALKDYFGPGRFTVAGLLDLADDEPHGDVGRALGDAIDLAASPRSRATALGRLLARTPAVEIVASVRGSAVYRLVDADE